MAGQPQLTPAAYQHQFPQNGLETAYQPVVTSQAYVTNPAAAAAAAAAAAVPHTQAETPPAYSQPQEAQPVYSQPQPTAEQAGIALAQPPTDQPGAASQPSLIPQQPVSGSSVSVALYKPSHLCIPHSFFISTHAQVKGAHCA